MLVFLALASLAARLTSSCTCDTNCTEVHDIHHGAWCMDDCGFAILKGVYDKGLLEEIQKAFQNWYDSPQARLFGNQFGRYPWVEVGLPDTHPFNKRELFYNRNVSQMLEKYYELGNLSLETVTFMHNPPGVKNQDWHIDAIELPFAIKVYIPLSDVSLDMGPIEMSIIKHDVWSTFKMNRDAWKADEDTVRRYQEEFGNERDYYFAKHKGFLLDCTVKGNVERGTVIAYVNAAYHRGTPNLSGRNRTVLFHSYMTAKQVELYTRDRDSFRPEASRLLYNHQRLYHEYRDEDRELLLKELDASPQLTIKSPSDEL